MNWLEETGHAVACCVRDGGGGCHLGQMARWTIVTVAVLDLQEGAFLT
jgi:serine/threonine protein phosphatase PrpC